MPFPRVAMFLCGGCVLAAAALLSATGCRPRTSPREKLASRIPYERAIGTIDVAEKGDVDAAPQLVGLLEDHDPAVRMYAILALERLFGVDYGYRYYAPEYERFAAVERWRDAIRRGELGVRPSSASERPPEGQDSHQ